MIFFKKDPVLGVDLETAINNAVFPGLQVSLTSFSPITNLNSPIPTFLWASGFQIEAFKL